MPNVPTYDTPQVAATALPGVRQESAATPALLGGAGEAQQNTGAGLMAAGTGIAAVAYQMQQKEDLQKVQDASADYGKRVLDWRMEMEQKRTGAAASGAVTDFSDFHKQTVEEISKSLGNETQRRAFQVMAAKNGLTVRHDVGTFEIAQMRRANADADKANATNYINQGAVAITPEAADEAKRLLVNSTEAYLATQNTTPELRSAIVTERLTEFHKQRIQTLARDNPAAATEYYKANEKEIAGSQRAEIGEFANKATSAAVGGDAAQAVFDKFARPRGEAMPLDEMAAALRNDPALKKNPDALKVALATVKDMAAERDKATHDIQAAGTAKVNKMLMDGRPLSQVMRTPEWAALNGTEQRKITEHEEGIAAQRESRAAARESRAFTAEQRREFQLNNAGLETMMRLSNPDALVAMSRDDVINLRTTIGTQNAISLLNKWDAFTKNGTVLSEAKVDDNQFKKFAQKAGLDPYVSAAKNEQMAGRVNDLRNDIEQVIGAEQMAKKRPLTRDEKDAIFQREIDNNVMLHSRVWFDQKVPAITVRPDDMSRAYVEVGDRRVFVSDIPRDFRSEAVAELRKRGKAANEADIARLWVRTQDAKQKRQAEGMK